MFVNKGRLAGCQAINMATFSDCPDKLHFGRAFGFRKNTFLKGQANRGNITQVSRRIWTTLLVDGGNTKVIDQEFRRN